MQGTAVRTRVRALVVASAALIAVFFGVVRPWYLRWGATDEETRRVLPGDEFIPNSRAQETRVITIGASVERVWPWLAQIGQDRGGFYSYDLLENLIGCGVPTEDRLRSDKQMWQLGDKLWMYPPDKAGGAGFATLRTYIPGRVLGFATRATGTALRKPGDGSWTFILEPIGDASTRLIIRGRGAGGRSLLGVWFDRSIFEPIHFVMERRMMIGLKQLAEGADRRRMANHAQIALWTVTFGFFIAARMLVMVRERWIRPLVGFVAAAVVFQILTFGQPPLPLAVLLTSVVGAIVFPIRAARAHSRRYQENIEGFRDAGGVGSAAVQPVDPTS